MKLILLSGGAGKRLWPLSSELLPKQFMKILRNDNGDTISMVQKTWGLLADKFGAQSIYLTAPGSHETVLREQLGTEARLIREPSARDTFPAIAGSCSYLAAHACADPDEVIVAMPVDAFVQADFYDTMLQLEASVRENRAQIALVGIRPKYASEKYGYIIPVHPASYAEPSPVNHFIEKPDAETASKLIKSGALWNSGIFAFKLSYMERFMESSAYPWAYDELIKHYDTLPRISFDYMVVEPEKSIYCHVYEGEWTDLGTWAELVKMLRPDQSDHVVTDDNCHNTFIINQLGIPIIIAGISNAVVAASPDGILITDQSVSHTIKPLIEKLPYSPA